MNEVAEQITIKGGSMKGNVQIKEVSLNKIKLARNSRKDIRDEELAGLMSSIRQVGLLQPIGVVKSGAAYEVIYGNRRFLAVSKLGMSKIPAIVHEHKNQAEGDLKNLTENIQRRNIGLVEAGRYIYLLKQQGLSNAEEGVRLGVDRSYILACVSAYADVPKAYQQDVVVNTSKNRRRVAGKISIGVAQAIITATKKEGLNQYKERLFELAKAEDRFEMRDVPRYAAALKEGVKNPVQELDRARRVEVQFYIQDSYNQTLYEKHVTRGPFKSLNGYFVSVLRGEHANNLKVRT